MESGDSLFGVDCVLHCLTILRWNLWIIVLVCVILGSGLFCRLTLAGNHACMFEVS